MHLSTFIISCLLVWASDEHHSALVGGKGEKKKKEANEISSQEDFEMQQKLWEKHSRAMINVAHTAVEISDLVPAVSQGLRRISAINGLVNLVSDVLDDVHGLDTRSIRPPLKKDANQMDTLRVKMQDLNTLVPKVSGTIVKMAHWLSHAVSLTDHILSKLDRFADFEDVWHHKIAPWYTSKGGEGAEEVKQTGELALKECAEILRLVNDRITKIQGMTDFLNGYKTYLDISEKVEAVENKLSEFLEALRQKSVTAVLPAEHCLERKMDQVNEINSLLDTLGGLKDTSRRRLASWQWNDLDFSSIDLSDSDSDEREISNENVPDFSNANSWRWSDLDDVEHEISNRDSTESERDPELRKLMKRFKRKTLQKMEFKGAQDVDCLNSRMERHTLMDLLATAESIQKFGAYSVLRAIFIPMFKQAGIWGGADAPLIQLSLAIVKHRETPITRFNSKTYANVLTNVEVVAGKVCGIMALGTERVHAFSVLIGKLARRAAVLDPPEEVLLFLETARGLFDSSNVVHMMSTFFTHCKAPNLAPSQGAPNKEKKKPCPKKEDEPQPLDVPDSEKGTPEERGVLKEPKIVPETDDGDEAVAATEENSEYEDVGIVAENTDYLSEYH